MLNNPMKFKNWLQLNEMPAFSMNGNLSIPCPTIIAAAGIDMPCVAGKKIGYIDMRFEDYPPEFAAIKKLNVFKDVWVAKVPGSSEYLVHMNATPKLMFATELEQQGMLASRPGEKSESGATLLPDEWFVYAQLLDTDYEPIKPPLSVVKGNRTA